MTDVLIVSLASTAGLRAADEELCEALRRAGADAQIASVPPQREVRTLMATDLLWARGARAAAQAHLRRHRTAAVIYSSTTAALLWPEPGAIRFDAPAAANRPGHHGLWQRPLERRRLRQAPLLLPYSEGALRELGGAVSFGARALVLPVAIAASGASLPDRDIAAITYAANPAKKGLDRVLEAWGRARRAGEELFLAGVCAAELERAGLELPAEGVHVTGMLPRTQYRALLRRARVFVCAPRREDYGQAQLEALADGCQLVSTEAPGPYAALALAMQIDRRLIGEDLARSLRLALDEPLESYRESAQRLLEPFARERVDKLVREELLARLLEAP